MVAYTFAPRFVVPIREGQKRQAILLPRRRKHAVAGDAVQLFRGFRNKGEVLIGQAWCTRSAECFIDFAGGFIVIGEDDPISGRAERDALALREGYADWADMLWNFARICGDDRRFRGTIIEWGALWETPST
jgi:hypothetical protein